MNIGLFLFWLAAAFDPGRGLAYWRLGTVQASGDDILLKEPAQVFASGMIAQCNGAPVNGFFQFRRTAEAERHISTGGTFLYGHKVTIKSYLMNNSQESKGQDLGHWMNEISGYPPLETRGAVEPDSDESHHRLSVSVPLEIKVFVTERAKALGLSRSHYIRLLVNADIAKK